MDIPMDTTPAVRIWPAETAELIIQSARGLTRYKPFSCQKEVAECLGSDPTSVIRPGSYEEAPMVHAGQGSDAS